VISPDIAAALGDARVDGGRLEHGGRSLARPDNAGGDYRPVKIVVEPTASGKKWSATANGRVIASSLGRSS
jgi:hypothetical protein